MSGIRAVAAILAVALSLGGCAAGIKTNPTLFVPVPASPAPTTETAASQSSIPGVSANPPTAVQPATSQTAATAMPPDQEGKQQAADGFRNLMPMSTLKSASRSSENGINYSDRYTRVIVMSNQGCTSVNSSQRCSQPENQPISHDSKPTANSDASMGYKSTGFFSRYFVQPKRSMALSVNVSAGAFTATVPLMSLSHSGDRNGDAWNRTIYSQAEQFPWFLVRADGSNSILSTRFTLSAAESIQFEGAVASLNVAVSLAREFAPQGTLVTALTESSAKTRAQALDNTLSSLFAKNIAEQHWSDSDIRQWHRGYGLQLDVRLPSESGDLTGIVSDVGSWIVTLDQPRQSIFSDIRTCGDDDGNGCAANDDTARKRILSSVGAADVLSFNIIPLAPPNASLGTVATYISQHDGFATALSSMSTNTTNADAIPQQLCRNIRGWTSSLGFSTLDQDIILWAVATGLPSVSTKKGDELLSACEDDALKALQRKSQRDARR